MATWATFTDVTDRWVGNDVPTDSALVETLLGDAEQVILATYPGLQARIDADTIPVERVTMVVVAMVTRLLRNPEWVRTLQETVGAFSQSRTFMGNDSGLFMTESETAILSPSTRTKAFEVNLGYRAGSPNDTIWLDVSGY
jgi:hypothetical protein